MTRIPVVLWLLALGQWSVMAQPQGCRPTADVIFLLDGSDSISPDEFKQQTEFLRRFTQLSDVGLQTIRVGVAVISSAVGDTMQLSTSSDKEILFAGFDNLTQPQEGSRTDLGLVKMEQMFGTDGRPGVLRIGVVITDGRAKFEKATIAEAQVVKDAGVFLIAIGVGRLIKFPELIKIASTKSNAYHLMPLELSSKLLSDTVKFLGKESCTGHELIDLHSTPSTPLPTNNMVKVVPTVTPPALPSTIAPATRRPFINFPPKPESKIHSFTLVPLAPELMSQLINIPPGLKIDALPPMETPKTKIPQNINVKPSVVNSIPLNSVMSTKNLIAANPIQQLFDFPEMPNLSFNVPLKTQNKPVPTTRREITPATTTAASPVTPINDTELALYHCSKAKFVNGIGYTHAQDSCTEFYQCYEQNGVMKVDIARCPFETLFDDVNAVCKFHDEGTCSRDPCNHPALQSYQHPDNCRAYWSCNTGSSVPSCCPRGAAYVPGRGCVSDINCTDTCLDFGPLPAVMAASQCKLLPMDTNRHFYFESVAGLGLMVRQCPEGTEFDKLLCHCRTEQLVSATNCKPELILDFHGGLQDKSGQSLPMGVTNVDIDGGAGMFDGRSLIKLWRFSGVSLGQKITVTFRFRVSVMAPKGKLMHLVSNCCYGCQTVPKPSIDIAIIPGPNEGIAVFSASTAAAGEIFVYVPYKDTFTGWNNLKYVYDGYTLTGTVNSDSASKSIIGDLEARAEALTIGACGATGGYQGYIDDFKFYSCNPSR